MFGFQKHAAKSVKMFLHPGDLNLGARAGNHPPYDFEDDIVGAFLRGIGSGVQSSGFTEVSGSVSAPDFAGAVYRQYTGTGGSAILTRILANSSVYQGVASCSIEIAYLKNDAGGAEAAGVIVRAVENELRSLKTLGSIRSDSEMSKAMKSQTKAALG